MRVAAYQRGHLDLSRLEEFLGPGGLRGASRGSRAFRRGVFEAGASLCRDDPGLSRVHAFFHSGLTGTDTRFPHLGQFTVPPAAGPSSSQSSLKAFSNSCRIRIASAAFKPPPVVTNQSNFRWAAASRSDFLLNVPSCAVPALLLWIAS